MDKLPGSFFFCTACGKISLTKTGFDANGRFVAERGWDVSCMLNASEVMTSTVVGEYITRLEELWKTVGL